MLENFDMTVIKATAMSMAFILAVGNIIINFIIKTKKEELREQLNKISDNRILNMKVMLQSSDSFYEDDIIDLFLKNNGNNEDVEELAGRYTGI